MSVSKMIAAAFAHAAQTHASLDEAWIRVSHHLGGALPDSLLMHSVQRDGRLDLVLRCMEDERVAYAQAPEQEGLFELPYQIMLSEMWVGSVYETLRLLTDRKRQLIVTTDDIRDLAADFKLVRITLEKHEIADDWRHLDAPLQLQRHPPQNDQTDLCEYDKADPKRAHIMQVGPSPRGSVTWHVIDLKKRQERWIERRDLSDRIIARWGRDDLTAQTDQETQRFEVDRRHP
jgi:hypothetical protein